MDYQKHYNLLIKRGKDRNLSEGFESHHIIPRCMGGTNIKENLVRLTPEEHYIAHQLLSKIYPKQSGLIYAVRAMTMNYNGCRINNKLFGWIKRLHSNAVSEQMIGNTYAKGKKNPGAAEANRKRKGIPSGRKGEKNPGASKANKGKPSPMKGKKGNPSPLKGKFNLIVSAALKNKPKSEEHKKNMRKPQKVITCPKCGKQGGNIMKKHHFDNCRLVNDQS